MGDTTTLTRLERIKPASETHWRAIASRAHRIRSFPGDESAARTHELVISEIRDAHQEGSSRGMRVCPRCEAKGNKIALIFMGGSDQCGTCYWPRERCS